MKTVSNTFSLTAVINGKSFLVDVEMVSGSLHQFYDKSTQTFNPDWTKGNRPSFKMVVRDTEGKPYEVNDAQLYYQGSKITFSNGSSTNIIEAGTFTYVDKPEDKATNTPAYRQFTIAKNLASDTNTDNDYIALEGVVVTEGNNTQTLKTGNIPISIMQTANGGVSYYLTISAPPITTEGGKTTLVAKLFSSDTSGEVSLTGLTGKWEKLNGTAWEVISGQTSYKLEVTDDSIDGVEMYRYSVIPISGGAESSRIYAVTSVMDQTDNLFCELECTGTTVPWKVQKGETAKITAKVVDKNGNEQTETGLTPTIRLVKADGNEPSSQPTGASVSISYNDLISVYGSSLTGYVSFEKNHKP